MRRALIVIGALILVAGGALLLVRGGRSQRAPAAVPAEGTSEVDSPSAAPAPTAVAEERAQALRRVRELARGHAPKQIVASSAERRPDEPEAFFQERTRALAEYQRFIRDAQVPPERDEALRRIIVDAQDNWVLALKAARKPQPLAPGGEMADPVLSQVFVALDQDFRQSARQALTDNQAAIFQSEVPSVLPFLRTRAFEVK